MAACLASILEVNISKVPNFVDAPPVPDECPFPAWWLALQSWLAEKGCFFLEMQLNANTPFLPLPLPALCIFFGETTSGIKHAIVGRVEEDRMLPVFNPWPEAEFAGGIGAIGFLVPRDPHTVIQMGIALERIEKIAKSEEGGAPKWDSVADEVRKGLVRPDVSMILSGLNGSGK